MIAEYAKSIAETVEFTHATMGAALNETLDLDETLDLVARFCRRDSYKVLLVGNGGSAAIASHAAIDFNKAAGVHALALNDAATLTCLSNDMGYEHVFAEQVCWHARAGDMVIAISSSGQSANILRAAQAAMDMGCRVVTFSGFAMGNPLRASGWVNFWAPSTSYGFVEIAHQTLLHAISDEIARGNRRQ